VTGQTGLDSDIAITLRELERNAAVNKTLFEDYLQRAKITQEQSTFEAREARVITTCAASRWAEFSAEARYMTIALVIGLLLGVGGAYAKEKLNSGLRRRDRLKAFWSFPLLTSVRSDGAARLTVDGKVITIPLYPAARPLSRYSEAIRGLRSGIAMTDVDSPPRSSK